MCVTQNKKEMTELETIDLMITKLKGLKKDLIKRDADSKKLGEIDFRSVSRGSYQKMTTNLNWLCMNLEKQRTSFARLFKGSDLDVETGEREYNPSGFHSYKG